MRPTYGILDLITLVGKLLAPFVDPLRAEFATRTGDKPVQPADGVAVPPQPAPTSTDFEFSKLRNFHRHGTPPQFARVPETTTTAVTRLAVADARPAQAFVVMPPAPDAGITVTPAAAPDPLFVRKAAGKKWRYHVAQADAPGPKFRRLSVGKRVRYEPAR